MKTTIQTTKLMISLVVCILVTVETLSCIIYRTSIKKINLTQQNSCKFFSAVIQSRPIYVVLIWPHDYFPKFGDLSKNVLQCIWIENTLSKAYQTHILACLKRICAQYVYGTHMGVPPTSLYVSRNTYIRAGIAEWKISNPVHVVCYFRYLRFYPSGRFLYKNSSQKVKDVAKFMNFRASKAESVHSGHYTLSNDKVDAAFLYPGLRPTVWRIRLRLRGTMAGANNRMDLLSLVTSGVNDGEVSSPDEDILGVVEGWQEDETHNPDVPAVTHKRGLTPFVFIPYEEAETSVLNLPVERMDYFVPG